MKSPNVPISRSDQEKSSQGAKRYLTGAFLKARFDLTSRYEDVNQDREEGFMKKIEYECCEATEVHEELLALVREKMPQEEELYDI